MPNNIINVWKISHIPQYKVQYILDKITMVTKEGNRIIDFDLIIPAPKLKADCPKDSIRKSSSCSQIDEAKPWFDWWFDWYEFNTKYWGTKWNAYDGYTKINKTSIQLIFNTAWNFAYPIALALTEICKKNRLDCELKYADEDYGNNCGILIYNHETDDITHYDQDDLKPTAEKWARSLWDRY